MHPILFSAGPVTIYSYGVLLAGAYLAGLWLAVRRAKAAGIDGNRIMDLLIWVIIAALVGAKALLFVVDFQHFTSSWAEFTMLLRSGGVFYGGLIAAILIGVYQLRKHRLPLWPATDLFSPGIALGYMVGRLGCLMAGCCYGKPTEVAWAITFTDPAANFNVGTPLNVALHPTQRTRRPRAWSFWSPCWCSRSGPSRSRDAPSGASLSCIPCSASSSSSTVGTTAGWSSTCCRRRSSSRWCLVHSA